MRARTSLTALFLTLVALATVPGLAQALSGNLLDGGFESPTTTPPWTLATAATQSGGSDLTITAARDCTVAHSGYCSLKLLHRAWGGRADQTVAYPLSGMAASTATLTYSYNSPSGGASWNKWLTVEVNCFDSSNSQVCHNENDHFSSTSGWVSTSLSVSVPSTAVTVVVSLHTQNGDGGYTGTDWASWVDDVALNYA